MAGLWVSRQGNRQFLELSGDLEEPRGRSPKWLPLQATVPTAQAQMETTSERSRSRLHLVPLQQGSSSTWVPQTRYASPQASHGRNNHCSPLTGFLEAGGPMVFQDRLRQVVPARFAVVCHLTRLLGHGSVPKSFWASRRPTFN